MNVALLMGLLPVIIFCFPYATYCLYRGGVFVKNKGWKTKEEAPIHFLINIVVMYAIGLFSLLTILGVIEPAIFSR